MRQFGHVFHKILARNKTMLITPDFTIYRVITLFYTIYRSCNHAVLHYLHIVLSSCIILLTDRLITLYLQYSHIVLCRNGVHEFDVILGLTGGISTVWLEHHDV